MRRSPDAAAQDHEGVDAPSRVDVPLPPASHDHHDVEGKDGLRVWSRAAPATEPEVWTTQLDVTSQREKMGDQRWTPRDTGAWNPTGCH